MEGMMFANHQDGLPLFLFSSSGSHNHRGQARDCT